MATLVYVIIYAVCLCSASEMTYIVSSGALNFTHPSVCLW